jgi:hypothetical protein
LRQRRRASTIHNIWDCDGRVDGPKGD